MVREQRQLRRRRSVARTPALVAPIDIPEDAPGRVEFIAVRAPADVVAPQGGDDEASAPTAPPPDERAGPWMSQWGGWLAVGVLIAVAVLVFLAGMAITR